MAKQKNNFNRLATMVNDLHSESSGSDSLSTKQLKAMLLTSECISARLQAEIFRMEKEAA